MEQSRGSTADDPAHVDQLKIGRKDIIIVAVLVNVALLSLVFATSTHSTIPPTVALDSVASRQAENCLVGQAAELSVGSTRQAPADEIDAILQEMAREGNARERRRPPSSPKTSCASKGESDLSTAEYYVIKSGDNPWKIARRFNMDFEELLALNSLDEEKARNLKIGQKIRIR